MESKKWGGVREGAGRPKGKTAAGERKDSVKKHCPFLLQKNGGTSWI